jgi:hypothetical protein
MSEPTTVANLDVYHIASNNHYFELIYVGQSEWNHHGSKNMAA